MLEPTTRVCTNMKDERVVAIRNLTTHQLDLRFDDLLHVAAHSFRIVVPCSVDYDPVRNAFDVEYERLEVAGFEWRVVKDVEIFGAENISLSRHCR